MLARAALISCSLITAAALRTAQSSPQSQLTPPGAAVELRIATLHAAALTSPRAPHDSVDAPYLLVSVVGPRTKSHAFTFPAEGRWSIHLDQALGARALETLQLGDGDSVRVLVTVMERGRADRSVMDRAAAEAASGPAENARERNRIVSAAVEPLVNGGARWIGSAALLLTRDAGVSYWRGLDCLATCKVISGAAPVSLDATAAAPPSGVIELSGAGATYHLKLEAREHGH